MTLLSSKVRAFYIFSPPLTPLLDVCGKLESEDVVGVDIKYTPNLWCYEESEELPQSLSSQPALSSNWNGSHSSTATRITSAAGIPMCDWREPIHRMLQSQNVYIRFTDESPLAAPAPATQLLPL
jgi:hypothetical protein